MTKNKKNILKNISAAIYSINFLSIDFIFVFSLVLLPIASLLGCWSIFFSVIGIILTFFCFFAYFIGLFKLETYLRELPRTLILVAIIGIIMFIIIIFSLGYFNAGKIGSHITDSNRQPICQLVDYLYFSVVTATTLGYGDLIPHSNAVLVKVFIILEVLFGPTLLFFVISLQKR